MDNGQRLFREARELIEIESITGAEGACVDHAERLLRDSGLPVESIPVAPGRRDLLAGPPEPRVLLCTHLDTVPPYVPYSEDEEFLRGRGTCDAKGIAAAMLEAARRLLAAGRKDFGILLVVGEEVDHAGALAADARVRAKSIIVGEPTRNLLARGHKGVLHIRLHAKGRAAHSAYPERGESAVHILLEAIQRLRVADFGSDPVLGNCTVNVGRIAGGVAPNVLAPEAWAELMFRAAVPLADLRRGIEACLWPEGGRATDPRLSVGEVTSMPPTRTGELAGFPTTVVSFGTDIPFLGRVGTPYLIGPGDILDAHTADEKVARRELLEGAAIYEKMVGMLLD